MPAPRPLADATATVNNEIPDARTRSGTSRPCPWENVARGTHGRGTADLKNTHTPGRRRRGRHSFVRRLVSVVPCRAASRGPAGSVKTLSREPARGATPPIAHPRAGTKPPADGLPVAAVGPGLSYRRPHTTPVGPRALSPLPNRPPPTGACEYKTSARARTWLPAAGKECDARCRALFSDLAQDAPTNVPVRDGRGGSKGSVTEGDCAIHRWR